MRPMDYRFILFWYSVTEVDIDLACSDDDLSAAFLRARWSYWSILIVYKYLVILLIMGDSLT
jgi:hypothetical protein